MSVSVEKDIGLGEGEGVGFGDIAFYASDTGLYEFCDEGLAAFCWFESARASGDECFADCSGEKFDVFVPFVTECTIIAPPVDIAHEGFFGFLKFVGLVENSVESALLEAVGGTIHKGLELTVATSLSVSGFVEKEWTFCCGCG